MADFPSMLLFMGLSLRYRIIAHYHALLKCLYWDIMIDGWDYEAFIWIKEKVGEDYERAILDP